MQERIYQRAKAQKGFALMTQEQKKAIASLGGQMAHKKGAAHKFNSETAKSAGRKGGHAVSQNREHMASIGRKGGAMRASKMGENNYDELIAHYEKTSSDSNR